MISLVQHGGCFFGRYGSTVASNDQTGKFALAVMT